jgi:hypothetical protein
MIFCRPAHDTIAPGGLFLRVSEDTSNKEGVKRGEPNMAILGEIKGCKFHFPALYSPFTLIVERIDR